MTQISFSIASSAFAAQSLAMDTVGQNIANSATPGYVREQAQLSAVGSVGAGGQGAGVQATAITQIHSALLDAAATAAQGAQGNLALTSQILQSAQSSFQEPSSSGLGAQLSTLWSSWSTLAGTPGDPTAQQQVVSAAQQVATTLNQDAANLTSLRSGLLQQLGTGASATPGTSLVSQANSLLGQVATLNQAVISQTGAGADTGPLIDQRSQLVQQLAGLLGVHATSQANGSLTVALGGLTLVQGTTATSLSASVSTAGTDPGAVTLNVGGQSLSAAGGSIGGALSLLNNQLYPNNFPANPASSPHSQSYMVALDQVAASLASTVNSQQLAGVDPAGQPGQALFVSSSTQSGAGVTAANIAVASTVQATPSLLATASGPGTTPATPTLDGTNAQATAALATAANGADAAYRNLVGQVGSATQAVTSQYTAQQAITSQAQAAASSVSGVNANQEGVSLLAYQQAYQAATKFLSTVSTALDSLLQAV